MDLNTRMLFAGITHSSLSQPQRVTVPVGHFCLAAAGIYKTDAKSDPLCLQLEALFVVCLNRFKSVLIERVRERERDSERVKARERERERARARERESERKREREGGRERKRKRERKREREHICTYPCTRARARTHTTQLH